MFFNKITVCNKVIIDSLSSEFLQLIYKYTSTLCLMNYFPVFRMLDALKNFIA